MKGWQLQLAIMFGALVVATLVAELLGADQHRHRAHLRPDRVRHRHDVRDRSALMVDEADKLYGLPLEEFVAQRDALAKQLRADGRRADADEVKALRKPPAVVWAVNQLMRTQRKAARALVQAADRAAKHPGDRDALRAHHDALDELARAGEGLLSGKGHGLSEDALLRVRGALHAASLDREHRDGFVAGRLSEEPPPAGFGAITAMPPPKTRKSEPKPQPKPSRSRNRSPSRRPRRSNASSARRRLWRRLARASRTPSRSWRTRRRRWTIRAEPAAVAAAAPARDLPLPLLLDQRERVIARLLVGGGRMDGHERLVAVDRDRPDRQLRVLDAVEARLRASSHGTPRASSASIRSRRSSLSHSFW